MTAQIIPVDPDNTRTLARHATEIKRLGKQVTSDVIEIGRLLVESKNLAGHGNWLPWLETNFGWADRTAQRCMSVYEMVAKSDTVSYLALPMKAIFLLSAPSTPETAKQEVISRAKAGEPMTVNTVKEVVGRAKATPAAPAEDTARKEPHGRLPRLLKAGTIVEANMEHARFFRVGFLRGPIELIQDCGGNCERRDDGHYDYSIQATAIISGEHLKWVSKPDISKEAELGPIYFQISPCTVKSIEEWRLREPDLPHVRER